MAWSIALRQDIRRRRARAKVTIGAGNMQGSKAVRSTKQRGRGEGYPGGLELGLDAHFRML